MKKDSLQAPFLQCWRQTLRCVVCGLWAGSALYYKLLTLLKLKAQRQPAGFLLPMNDPVAMLICDCCYGRRIRDRRERAQVKVALMADFNLAVGGEVDSGAGNWYRWSPASLMKQGKWAKWVRKRVKSKTVGFTFYLYPLPRWHFSLKEGRSQSGGCWNWSQPQKLRCDFNKDDF